MTVGAIIGEPLVVQFVGEGDADFGKLEVLRLMELVGLNPQVFWNRFTRPRIQVGGNVNALESRGSRGAAGFDFV